MCQTMMIDLAKEIYGFSYGSSESRNVFFGVV
jgi:hypothetical protein